MWMTIRQSLRGEFFVNTFLLEQYHFYGYSKLLPLELSTLSSKTRQNGT